jgi:hypothetical protein
MDGHVLFDDLSPFIRQRLREQLFAAAVFEKGEHRAVNEKWQFERKGSGTQRGVAAATGVLEY